MTAGAGVAGWAYTYWAVDVRETCAAVVAGKVGAEVDGGVAVKSVPAWVARAAEINKKNILP